VGRAVFADEHVDTLLSRSLIRNVDLADRSVERPGRNRLLAELVRRGLSESALPVAALLVCELDARPDDDEISPQTSEQRLSSRQRVRAERDASGRKPAGPRSARR
jgi:hypothetical protein